MGCSQYYVLSVRQLGIAAARALSNGGSGRIIAVFEHTAYVALGVEPGMVCVGSASLPAGPLSVITTAAANTRFGQPRVHDAVHVVGSSVLLAGKPWLDLQDAQVWHPPSPPHFDSDAVRSGLDALIARTDEPVPSTAATARHLDARLSLLRAAASASLHGNAITFDDVDWPVELLGLGEGLTPTGDDLLVGMLVALGSIGKLAARDALGARLRPHLAARTSPISAAHLVAAMGGGAAAPLHAMLHEVMLGAPHPGRLGAALHALQQVGHRSGLDALDGAVLVLDA